MYTYIQIYIIYIERGGERERGGESERDGPRRD